MKPNYHETLGAAITELFRSYEDYYGITDMFYSIEDLGKEVAVKIGMAPNVEQMGGGRTDTLAIKVVLATDNLESIETARADIPKLHKKFISAMGTEVRRQLINRYRPGNKV